MMGISRKASERERIRLKKDPQAVVPDSAGVIVRTTQLKGQRKNKFAMFAVWVSSGTMNQTFHDEERPGVAGGEPELTFALSVTSSMKTCRAHH